MRAYVLIDTSLDNARRIVTDLRKWPEVLLVDVVNGPQPVIAILEGDDPSSIAQTILFDVRKIEGVSDLIVYLKLGTEQQKSTSLQDDRPCVILPDSSRAVVGETKQKLRKKKGSRKPND
jgi:DNA-binding Lrp family transcriptional regulator